MTSESIVRGKGVLPGYPAPRYPKLKRITSVEELMPKARYLVNQPLPRPWGHNYMNAGFELRTEDKILLVVRSEYHPWVVEAVTRAIRERGAKVDVIIQDSTPLSPDPEETASHEAIAIVPPESVNDDYNYYYTAICNFLRTSVANYLVERERYTKVISGFAGGLPAVTYPWYRLNYSSLEEFASNQIEFPYEVQKMIDDKVFVAIKACEKVRITDPEGTDVTFTNYDDERPYALCHQLGRPFNIGFQGVEDCTGVVAGTLSHLGCFPHIRAHIKDGLVIKVEGGGKYGEVWREKLEEYNKVEVPLLPACINSGQRVMFRHPGPGYFWWFECAIGTSPGVFRLPKETRFECFGNMLRERKRAGYIHNGFGLPVWPEAISILAAERIPWVHCHIHSVFPTYEGTLKDGSKIKLIDKGHLTALDDPEVREVSSKHGNPDELLREAWTPAIPGINILGDYMKDYGENPSKWIRKEGAEHPYYTD